MAARELSRRLSPEDAAFLMIDTDEGPANIGSIAIFEGEIDHRRFLQNVDSKLQLIPRYRQRIVPAPLSVARPSWEYDPHFNVRRHIFRRVLPGPGSDEQLLALATHIWEGRLDRNKPLWEMNLVHGLSGNRTAIVSKVHHCLVDGVGGVEMLMVVMDVTPDPPPPPPEEPYNPPPIPSRLALFRDGLFDAASESLDRWAGLQGSMANLLLGGDRTGFDTVVRGLRRAVPYFLNKMEPAHFNGKFTGRRQVALSSIPFEQVRAVRKASVGTVNDVILAALSMAMGRYLTHHGRNVEGHEFRALTPVNLRKEDEGGTWGNRISMLLVELPVYLTDPLETLETVAARTEELKQEHAADGIEMIGQALMGLPAPMGGLLGVVGTPKNTVAHMVATNVPGPMIPLYTVGHKLLEHYALAPLGWEMGVGLAITSYNQRLYITVQSDLALADDMDVLRDMFDDAYAALCRATGVDMEAPSVMEEREVAAA